MIARTILMAAATLALLAHPSAAQVIDPWEGGGGLTYEQYTFEEPAQAGLEQLTLVTVPLGVTRTLSHGLSLTVRSAWAQGEVLTAGGETLSLSGLTDTAVRLAWNPGGTLQLEVTGYAPTGQATHDDVESMVAGIIAADLLPLQISHWGTGGGIATSASIARNFGKLGLGASAAYRVTREFEPVDGDEFQYQPGNELNVRIAADYTLEGRRKLSIRVGLRQFDEDVVNGESLFQTGDRIEALATYSFPVSLRAAGAVYGSFVRRDQGTFLLGRGGEVEAQNLFLAGALARVPAFGGFFTPRVDARAFRPGEGPGEGYVVGAGGSLEVPVNPSLTILPSGTYRIGSVDLLGGDATAFTGWQAGLVIRYGSRSFRP